MVRISDPLFRKQWHFDLLGDIRTIWQEYSGQGVAVGVFDDGLQYRHYELAPNYRHDLELRLGGLRMDPTPIRTGGANPDAHGTAVAGLIAAAANGRGGVGVAWSADLTGINFLSDPDIFRRNGATALEWSAAFDVANNSWGYSNGTFFLADLREARWVREEMAAWETATALGRDGKGTVIVLAAGNDGTNANGSLINGMHEVINVAAIDRKGAAEWYSNYGANILVAAPAASVTTDLPGRQGYDKRGGGIGDFTRDFNGTSAATPVVSGVVALMLEADPTLTWRDVRQILATSAKLTGAVTGTRDDWAVGEAEFQNRPAKEDPQGDTWNDGGRHYSADYGFGRVDAYAAVRLAEVWQMIQTTDFDGGPDSLSVRNDRTVRFSGQDGATASLNVTVAQDMRIEHVEITLRLTYDTDRPAREDVLITLHAPDGSSFQLTYPLWKSQAASERGSGLSANALDGAEWTFGLSHALGLNAQGTWRLEVENMTRGPANGGGTIGKVQLDFSGDVWDADDVHHITRDYWLALREDGGRTTDGPSAARDGVIWDRDDGTDWIEMATIARDIDADLNDGGVFRVGNRTWFRIGDHDGIGGIENLVTGDGDDTLAGNGAANRLAAMRGNDRLDGAAGPDALQGGQGNDTLAGGTGDDRLSGEGGSDSLAGGDGNDSLSGGLGDDTMSGGIGADAFIYANPLSRSFGDDVVTDFDARSDWIQLGDDSLNFTGFDEFMARYVSDTAAGAVVEMGLQGSITLQGVGRGLLSASNFVFETFDLL